MPDEIGQRRHDRYLLREGHFLGFGAGLLLSRWWWAAIAWGALVGAGWFRDLIKEESHA